jgi:hypothetical protein
MLIVQLLDEGQGFGFVLPDQDGGELGGESGIVGRFGECVAEERFGFGEFLVSDEQVDEIG